MEQAGFPDSSKRARGGVTTYGVVFEEFFGGSDSALQLLSSGGLRGEKLLEETADWTPKEESDQHGGDQADIIS